MSRRRYVIGPSGQATRNVRYVDHPFGKEWPVRDHAPNAPRQLKISISEDNSCVWLCDREGSGVQMDREEALEMMAILNREFPLDVLGQV
jgi:hypothetical protein